jgi:hypothetical protein
MSSDPTHQPASAVIWTWRPAPVDPVTARRTRHGIFVRGGIGLVLAALLALWKPVLGAVAAGLALLFLTLALASPRSLYPRVERGVAAFARAVGLAVSWITLTLVHVLVFLPLGLLLRATGRLRITRSPDPGAASYWRPADRKGGGPERYERQF